MGTSITNTGTLQFTSLGASFQQNDSYSFELLDSPVDLVTITKTADQDSAYIGSIINYLVEIVVDESFDEMDVAVFSDILPEHLELVEESIKINDIVIPTATLDSISLGKLKAGTTTTIEYQCLVVE